MSQLKEARAKKSMDKKKKKFERQLVNGSPAKPAYHRQVPAFYVDAQGRKIVTHEELAGRCMTSADMILKQTNGAFLRIYAEPPAVPLAYMLFAYHQNCMVTNDIDTADVIMEIYEQENPPHILGTKDDVVYLALFKPEDGEMPWLIS